MQPSNKKEVSCKALEPIFHYAKLNNVDLNLLIKGVKYELSYLLKQNERVEWSVYCIIISNSRKYFTPVDFEMMGVSFIQRQSYFEGILSAFFLFTSNKIIEKIYKKIFQFGNSMFLCLSGNIERLGPNKIRATIYLDEGHDFCPELFFITKGVWEQLGKGVGQRGIKIDLNISFEKTIMNITWQKENYLIKIKQAIGWFFNLRKALLAFTDSHEDLIMQYEKLEESRNLLLQQTTQLKTAYEISTAIRQSLNISDTLKAITDILVREAGFTFASIHLFKDLEDVKIDIVTETGQEEKTISQIRQDVSINEKIIGELVVNPKTGIDYREIDELLKYLSPVINIAIHDALVLRAVTDYKDNLEQKVASRTSELQKARDQLSDTNELLKETQQIQNRFFTNISHEFRTPLTLILGPVQQLNERITDNKSKEELDLINRSAKKLNRLVDELLDISKIEAGEMKLKACPLNLVTVVKDMVLSFHSLAKRKKISFTLKSDSDEIIAYIDKDKVDKILSNVLSNAFKFTPEGGKVEVEIKPTPMSPPGRGIKVVGPNKEYVEISIGDTGIGIPQNQIDKIFDRFYQVDGSHTREQEGTGIGLALTKELIDLHKGKIEVESEESKGSIFRLTFPLGKDHLKPEEIFEKELEKKYEKEQVEIIEWNKTVERQDGHKNHLELSWQEPKSSLLLVEDNSDVRKYISTILENQYVIIEAKDGEEGLDKSFQQIPDLIISDIMMPKMDGFQLCSKLKSDARTSHIPIIMLTAKATINDKINGLEIGADDYIMKPFEAAELKARIINLLEQRKRLHERFRKYGLLKVDEQNIPSLDQKFLQKAIEEINNNLADTNLSVELLADKLAISKSVLNKKLSALTGDTPAELIKRIRLSKAAKLIEHNAANISEIALEVGFSNPAYFAECFKKQFGVIPSHYHSNS